MDDSANDGASRQRCISLVEAICEKYGLLESSDVPRSFSTKTNSKSDAPAVFMKIKSTAYARKRGMFNCNTNIFIFYNISFLTFSISMTYMFTFCVFKLSYMKLQFSFFRFACSG